MWGGGMRYGVWQWWMQYAVL